jgi:POT family proton-dependent oligopeptide transporter
MIIGTLVFYFLKDRYVVDPNGNAIGAKPKKAAELAIDDEIQAKFTNNSLIAGVFAFAALICLMYFAFGQNIIYSIIYSSGITLAGIILTDKSLTKIETQRIWVIYIISFFVIFFWAAFEQAGSSLTFIADNQCDRNFMGWEIPPSMVQIFNGLFVVLLAFPFSFIWDNLRKRNAEPISPVKQAIGLALISLSYLIIASNVSGLGNNGLLAVKWLVLLYFIQTCGELCLSPIGLSLVGKLAPKRFASLLYGVFFLSNASGYALAGTLGSILPATGDKFKKASELGVDLQGVLDKSIVPTSEQLTLLTKNQIPTAYPEFAGFTIHNLQEFFMVFVILCGVAALILFSISPLLKKMMHGVR